MMMIIMKKKKKKKLIYERKTTNLFIALLPIVHARMLTTTARCYLHNLHVCEREREHNVK